MDRGQQIFPLRPLRISNGIALIDKVGENFPFQILRWAEGKPKIKMCEEESVTKYGEVSAKKIKISGSKN